MNYEQLTSEKLDTFLTDHPNVTYYIRVAGVHLSTVGVVDGSVVAVDCLRDPAPGNIVLVRIDAHASPTIKQLCPPYLRDELTQMPITQETEVLGVVVSVCRRLC